MANDETVLGEGPAAHPSGFRRAGDQVAGFELLSRLDADSNNQFGEVWLAKRSMPAGRVAIKFLRSDRVDRELLRRFTDVESRALARFNHPFVARFFQLNPSPPSPYLVMEYVPGDTLCRYCDERKLGIRERLELIAKVCEAVQHVHLQGVIHRDLKPQNILVMDPLAGEGVEPLPKLIDFGLAKSANPDVPLGSALEAGGSAPGTRKYMSPEQLRGRHPEDTGRSADIYAMGAVLYELLAGVSPMEHVLSDDSLSGSQRLAALESAERPSLSAAFGRLDAKRRSEVARDRGLDEATLAKLLSSRLGHLTDRALRLDAHERFSSAAAMAADIRNFLADRDYSEAAAEPAVARMSRAARRHRVAVAAAALVVASLLVGLAAAIWGRSEARREAERANRLLGVTSTFLEELFGDEAGANMRIESLLAELEPEARANLDADDVMPQVASAVASGMRKVGRAEEGAVLAELVRNRLHQRYGDLDPRTIEADLDSLQLQISAGEDFAAAPTPEQAAVRRRQLEEVLRSLDELAMAADRASGSESELALGIRFTGAGVLALSGKKAKSMAEFDRLLAIARRSVDPRSELLADNRIGQLALMQGSSPLRDPNEPEDGLADLRAAASRYPGLRQDLQRNFGPKHPRVLRASLDHAMALYHLADAGQDGCEQQCIELLQQVLPEMQAVLGMSDYLTMSATAALGSRFIAAGRREEAAALLRFALPAARASGTGYREAVDDLAALLEEAEGAKKPVGQ